MPAFPVIPRRFLSDMARTWHEARQGSEPLLDPVGPLLRGVVGVTHA